MELLIAGLAGIALGLIIYRFLGSTDRSAYTERIRALETTVSERNTAYDNLQRQHGNEQQLRARAQAEAERIPVLEREKTAERQRVDHIILVQGLQSAWILLTHVLTKTRQRDIFVGFLSATFSKTSATARAVS